MDQEGESYHRGLSRLALMCIASGIPGGVTEYHYYDMNCSVIEVYHIIYYYLSCSMDHHL